VPSLQAEASRLPSGLKHAKNARAVAFQGQQSGVGQPVPVNHFEPRRSSSPGLGRCSSSSSNKSPNTRLPQHSVPGSCQRVIDAGGPLSPLLPARLSSGFRLPRRMSPDCQPDAYSVAAMRKHAKPLLRERLPVTCGRICAACKEESADRLLRVRRSDSAQCHGQAVCGV